MKSEVKYGLLAGLLVFALGLVIAYLGYRGTTMGSLLGILNWVVLAFAIYFGMLDRRTLHGGHLEYGQGFGSGMQVSVIAGAVAGVLQYIMAKFIDHGLTNSLYNQIEEKVRDQMEGKDVNEDQIQTGLRFAKMAATPGGQAVMTFLGCLIMGVILSLIIAAILKRDKHMGDMMANGTTTEIPPQE